MTVVGRKETLMEPSPRDHSDWLSSIVAALIGLWDFLSCLVSSIYGLLLGDREQKLISALKSATTFKDWEHIADEFDNLPRWSKWRSNPVDRLYDYKHLLEQCETLRKWREKGSMYRLAETIRPALPRRMYGVQNFGLYTKTYKSTKTLIHEYMDETIASLRTIASHPVSHSNRSGPHSDQERQNTLHGLKMTHGTTGLILQGGSIFGLCHLGVVKALSEQGILPRVIVGTATGAVMAALIGIHTEEDLPDFLRAGSINLSAFAASSRRAKEKAAEEHRAHQALGSFQKVVQWFANIKRRVDRYREHGFVLDPDTLAQCVADNVGDTTFEEAFKRTGRALNIIISSPSEEIAALQNHLTAPNTLIRSAAMASHVTNMSQNKLESLRLLKKDMHGNVVPVDYSIPNEKSQIKRSQSAIAQQNPVRRLRQQMNVDHFIVSQARPYIAPFAQPSLPFRRGSGADQRWITRLLGWLIMNAFRAAHSTRILPANIRRIVRDESIPADFDSVTLVPDVGLKDWLRLLKNPVKEDIDIWILKGERSVWPSLCALKIRMDIEMELQRIWDRIIHRRPSTPQRPRSEDVATSATNEEEEDRLLRELQSGSGGFIPGFTDMDDVTRSTDGAADGAAVEAFDDEEDGDEDEGIELALPLISRD